MELPVRTRKDSAAAGTKRQQQQAPRTTFLVLPRELRDQIYGYLLSDEYTKMPPYHTRPAAARGRQSEANKRDMSAAHTYRFHVNILGVNKQLRKEATEELYGRNSFVVVSWKWEELGETLNAFDLPIITDNQTAVARFVKFKNHSLRLHLDYPGVHDPVESLLMLHSDLKVLCRAIRYLGAFLWWPAHFIIKQSKSTGDCFGAYSNHNLPALRTKIEFNRVIAASEAEVFTKKVKLLAPLVDLRIAGQKLKVLGSQNGDAQIDFAKAVDDLTKLAAPSLAWVKIVAWDLLDILMALMTTANKLCRDGDYERASTHYWSAIVGVPFSHFFCNLPPIVAVSDAAPPVIMGLRVLSDAVAATGWLALRRGDFSEARRAQDLGLDVADLISHFLHPEEVLMPTGEDESIWVDQPPSWHFHPLCSFFTDNWPLAHYVGVFEDLHQQFPDDAHIAHDLEAFVRLGERNQTIALEERPKLLEKFSACALPPQIFTFQIPERNARPTKVSGWHDQEQYGEAVTCFKDNLTLGYHGYVAFPKQKD
ncbi:hypothetical protein KC331_g12438 [Hortaea werneckii]|uniref:F-box domain-containing protein n=1 Tax=Hortaea werneckii TaxID=91943 RepID=A0A3M7C7Q8_HORWE|nr:hypothetical protein KC331_g12438 [Hortaea werneckii]KAI7705393.1 hypothetical protein KC353_g12911 [Hortaea werneckii]RMY48023.1 hypothetical protein D0865_08337 [Hortaea werneckii]